MVKNSIVYLVCATINSKEGYKWQHYFIYASDCLDINTSCIYRIVDNDPYLGIKVLEQTDKENKNMTRKCIRDMYGNMCNIKIVYRVVCVNVKRLVEILVMKECVLLKNTLDISKHLVYFQIPFESTLLLLFVDRCCEMNKIM